MDAQSGLKISRISALLRIVISIIFIPVYLLVMMLISVVAGVEQVLCLVTGKRPPLALLRVADRLVCYSVQIGNYLTVIDTQAPFPFSALPPASVLFTQHIEASSTLAGYAGADDTTVLPGGGATEVAATFADAEDETYLNLTDDAQQVVRAEVELEGVEAVTVSVEEVTQLNPDKDVDELLDDTKVSFGVEQASTDNRVDDEGVFDNEEVGNPSEETLDLGQVRTVEAEVDEEETLVGEDVSEAGGVNDAAVATDNAAADSDDESKPA